MLETIGEKVRSLLEARNAAREQTLALSRELIRTCANAIRAIHRGEMDRAREMLRAAREAVEQMRQALRDHPEIYGAGYVHDCQKEYAEAVTFFAVVSGQAVPDPDAIGVEYPAYLNGIGEAVGEMRRHVLDQMRHGHLERAEELLTVMDEIYFLLVTMDFPDTLTGGLRRTTDAVRGIIEKTRGELTTALRQEELRASILHALAVVGRPATAGEAPATEETGERV